MINAIIQPCFSGANDDLFDMIEIDGKIMLFTNERLQKSDVPAGMYLYHLRMDDTLDHFSSLEPYVGMNHGGSVISSVSIDFSEKGYLPFTYDTLPNFLGEYMTLEQYMNRERYFEGSMNYG